jgi:hypothetical protein
MSASTRTVQGTLGIRHLGTALVAIALVVVLAVALALSQNVATKSQAAPAARPAPAFIDHGSRDEIGPGAAYGAAPAGNDHGLHARLLRGTNGTNGSNGGGPRLRAQ